MTELSEPERNEIINKMKKDPCYRKGLPPYTSFDIDLREDITETWGRDWGGQSSYAKLNAVVVQRPGPEAAPKEALADNQWYSLPTGLPDLEKMQLEWDNFIKVLNDNGVETISLNAEQPVHGTYGLPLRCITYCHETLMVKGGANYRASQRAKSTADFINKLKIVEEEVENILGKISLRKRELKLQKLTGD